MPQDIAGGAPNRVLRISLGVMTASQAKARAELLAALAREYFEPVKARRMNNADDGSDVGNPLFHG